MNTPKENFSIIFKAVRKLYNLHQSELAKQLGVTQGWISKIENEKLVPVILVWFRFTKEFGLLDPYCFTYGLIEIEKQKLNKLTNSDKKQNFLPKYSFTKEEICLSVKHIRPIVIYLETYHLNELKKFLNLVKVPFEFFIIMNHPLCYSFLEDFFYFILKIGFTSKLLLTKTLRYSQEDFFTLEVERYAYESPYTEDKIGYSFFEKEYKVKMNKEYINKIASTPCSIEIFEYSTLLPYLIIKCKKQNVSPFPVVSFNNPGEWQVQYAS